ncbi:MAG TPA: zf-HC2 domain-containing protein [Terriglobales bacterium]|jgi:hypothetical protein
MAGEFQSGMQCVEVEALLAEALDGTLQSSQLAAFEAHQQGCDSCRSMVAEARAGMNWLKGLDEAEPPRNLVHNILAQTIGALPSEHAVRAPRGEGWIDKLKARLAPIFAPVATPRFAMSFGMAFFSITMLLGIAGFHMSDLRHWDLSSRGITKTYYATEAKVIRYYENMRLVYEIESRVHDLKRAATPATNQQQPPQQEAPATNPKNPPKSELRRDNQPQTPNHSQAQGQPKLAASAAVVPAETLQARRQGSHLVTLMGALNRRLV